MSINMNEVAELSDRLAPALETAKNFDIKTEDDAAEASLHLAKLKTSYDVIEKKRKDATDPMNKALKEINSWFKPLTNSIQDARKVLGDKIISWKREENEKIAKEEARRQAISDKAAEKRGEENNKVIEVDRVEKTVGMATTRKGPKKFRLVDWDKLPDKWKTVNEEELNRFIRDKENEGVEIPGIEIYQEDIISIRGGF